MVKSENIKKIGLVGLGLMGQGISACLVAYGFEVIAYSRTEARKGETLKHIEQSLRKLIERGIIDKAEIKGWKNRFKYVANLEGLGDSEFVIETVGEDPLLKKYIYQTLEGIVGKDVVIATNTSGMPVSVLQESLLYKERFIGMHWAEPAEITKYLEIAPGRKTKLSTLDATRIIGTRCGKNLLF